MEEFLERQELPKFVQEKKLGNPTFLYLLMKLKLQLKISSQRKHQAQIALQMTSTKCLKKKKIPTNSTQTLPEN